MNETETKNCLTVVTRFESGRRGSKLLRSGKRPKQAHQRPSVRIARLMALAIRFEHLLKEGLVKDYANLAALGLTDRSLVSRLMNLRLLSPVIQEHLLGLENTDCQFFHKDLLPIARIPDWKAQLPLYVALCKRCGVEPPHELSNGH